MRTSVLTLGFIGLAACSAPSAPVPPTTATSNDTADSAPVVRCEHALPQGPLPKWEGSELLTAILNRNVERAKTLATGASLSERDSYQNTPLIAALSPVVREPAAPPIPEAQRQAELNTQIELVRLLLERGANPNQKGYRGETPLHKAAGTAYGDDHTIRVLSLLIEGNAKVNAQDDLGATALMEAVRTLRPTVVEFLLDRGADPSITDCKGRTALDIARDLDAQAVVESLNPAR